MTAVPKVDTCMVEECCFNRNARCHAAAIQVGGKHPRCDTFTPQSGSACGAPDLIGEVVAHHGGHADCQTYRPR